MNEVWVDPGEMCSASVGMLRRSCDRDAISTCVYCGEPFCDQHGERGPDYADICNRRECVAKQRDVEAHGEWRRRVQVFNNVSSCAAEPCGERMRHECSRCHIMFCELHVKEFDAVDRSARTPQRSRALVCGHCAERAPIWK